MLGRKREKTLGGQGVRGERGESISTGVEKILGRKRDRISGRGWKRCRGERSKGSQQGKGGKDLRGGGGARGQFQRDPHKKAGL